MEPHAIFMDLDGTLTYHSDRPSEKDRAALAQARKNGHIAVLNTGRAPGFLPAGIREYLSELDGAINGSVCVRFQGRQLLRAELPRSVLREVSRYYLETGIPGFLEGETGMFWFNEKRIGPENWLPVTDEGDFEGKYADHKVYKITAAARNTPEGLAMLRRHFQVIRFPTYTECVRKGYNKDTGMALIAEAAGIPRERCIGFGDSLNDLTMFRFAGISVAMGNAPEDVQREARYVTKPVQESGIAAFLEAYGLI